MFFKTFMAETDSVLKFRTSTVVIFHAELTHVQESLNEIFPALSKITIDFQIVFHSPILILKF